MNTDEMLRMAKCSDHKQFDNECVWCVRYYRNLIDTDYTPNYKVDQARLDRNYDVARLRSEITEMQFEINRLRALANYARHTSNCGSVNGPCTCGFVEIRS